MGAGFDVPGECMCNRLEIILENASPDPLVELRPRGATALLSLELSCRRHLL